MELEWGFVLLGYLVGIVCLFAIWIASANALEPMFEDKDVLLSRLQMCALPWQRDASEHVVKPTRGSNTGKGVAKESTTWNLDTCNAIFPRCMRQPYHSGPWEARLVRHDTDWDPTVAWVLHDTIWPMHVQFPWETDLKRCFQDVFQDVPFAAIDIRTDGLDLQILEVNGSFGLPLLWTFENTERALLLDIFRAWIQRAWSGSHHPQRWLSRAWKSLAIQWIRFQTRHVFSQVWF